MTRVVPSVVREGCSTAFKPQDSAAYPLYSPANEIPSSLHANMMHDQGARHRHRGTVNEPRRCPASSPTTLVSSTLSDDYVDNIKTHYSRSAHAAPCHTCHDFPLCRQGWTSPTLASDVQLLQSMEMSAHVIRRELQRHSPWASGTGDSPTRRSLCCACRGR